jgi:hypothetical protein
VKNSLAGRALRAIAGRRGCIVAPVSAEWQRERRIIAETRLSTQFLLSDPAALHILACVRAARNRPGAMAEAGVFKGGSARLICENKGDSPLHLFDIFEGLQGQSAAVSGEAREVQNHFGPVHGNLAEVKRLLDPFAGVHFHPGLFPDSAAGLEELRFSFVHLDLDLVGPTRSALEYFHPRLNPGGILIGDDYDDPQLRRCFEAYFETRPDTVMELPWSQVMVIRQGSEGSV